MATKLPPALFEQSSVYRTNRKHSVHGWLRFIPIIPSSTQADTHMILFGRSFSCFQFLPNATWESFSPVTLGRTSRVKWCREGSRCPCIGCRLWQLGLRFSYTALHRQEDILHPNGHSWMIKNDLTHHLSHNQWCSITREEVTQESSCSEDQFRHRESIR